MALTILVILSATSFLWYGLQCLFNKRMHREFKRFGLSRYRVLTGGLQLTGAAALYLGFLIPELFLIGSAGLAVLMLLGFSVRIAIRDSFLAAIPALLLMCLNSVIFYLAW